MTVKSQAERMMPGVFNPPHDYSIGGWRQTGDLRIRNGWFGAVVEEMWENREGLRTWERTTAAYMLRVRELA